MKRGERVEPKVQRNTLLDTLYRKYNGALMRFLKRQRIGREDAQEIVQETYCRLHQVSGVEAIEFPQAYLFRTAFNLARDSERRLRRWRVPEELSSAEQEIPSEEPTPYRVLNGEQELAIVRAALGELTPKCRRAFILNRFRQATYAQIATEMGVSVSMVEKYISQALAHLKRRLDEARLETSPPRTVKQNVAP